MGHVQSVVSLTIHPGWPFRAMIGGDRGSHVKLRLPTLWQHRSATASITDMISGAQDTKA